jgi:hypothetical protein
MRYPEAAAFQAPFAHAIFNALPYFLSCLWPANIQIDHQGD